jgi:hypothetical protein
LDLSNPLAKLMTSNIAKPKMQIKFNQFNSILQIINVEIPWKQTLHLQGHCHPKEEKEMWNSEHRNEEEIR